MNFGWLLLELDKVDPFEIDFSYFSKSIPLCKVCELIFESAFIVSDSVFSHIVNDHLEVRTSVAIDPLTGAAEKGALYTYEAIPRATVFWFEVVYSNPDYFRVDGKEPIKMDIDGTPANIAWLKSNVELGLKYFKTLGIGGMNTRGMGRIRVLLNEEE